MIKRIGFVALILGIAASGWSQTSGSASGINARKLAKLRALKMHILVPTYVPRGFHLKDFVIEHPKEPALMSWSASYEGSNRNHTFVIQMCSEGIGDIFFSLPNGDTAEANGGLAYASKIFGKGMVESYVKGKEKQWHMNWVELKSKPTFVSLIAYGMNASEGKRIIESLQWLK
jgi:hypothetical protein